MLYGLVYVGAAALFVGGAGLYTLAAWPPHDVTPPTEIVGTWDGRAKMGMNFVEQDSLDVHFSILSDGRVEGRIGDAALHGRFKANRGAIQRSLNWRTEWIVQGSLEGPVVAAEDLRRDGVNIPMNYVDGELRGTVHTTGWHVGTANTMVISAPWLRLRKS